MTSSTPSDSASQIIASKGAKLFSRAAHLLTPRPRTTPPEWAKNNRVYAPTSGRPGRRDPYLTPYVVPFQLAVHGRTHKRVVFVVSAQSGKTESVFDIIGERLDSAPVPMIFVGPSKQMLTEQLEPRLDELLRNTALKSSMAPDYLQKKTRKFVSGVPLRLAHGGSSTALKSDPAGLVVTDEADELMANVRGAGNPILLADARGDTHADFVHAVTSTPSEGIADIVRDPVSGLEFWDAPDSEEDLKAQVQSTIWRLWLSGTRHHWAWPCPHCGEYFIPRFECLQWEKPVGPDGRERPSTPSMALETAYLQCPQGCADPILEEHKEGMNARGVYVAPGQSIEPDGTVIGPTPKSWTLSFWVSGLCSPFVSFGERAARYVEAVRSGDPESIKAVKNQGFGELYSPPSGSVPEWSHLMSLRLPYARGDVPKGVLFLAAGVDVQGDRLVYVVRGWGYRQESWLIDHGEIWGDTQYDDVWFELADYLSQEFGGMHIRRAFIDSGFRPGKKITVPVHMVYEFCHRYRRVAYPTKGQDRRRTPLAVTRIDVTPGGGKPEYGVDLVLLDTDFLKCFVHQRLTWPAGQPGGWHLHQDVDEGYCRQIVSEARVKKPKGDGFKWQPKSKQNHFLDAESLAYAAAYMLGVQRLVSRNDERPQKGAAPDGGDEAADQQATAAPSAQAAPKAVPAGPRQVFGKQSAAASLARLNRPRGETS